MPSPRALPDDPPLRAVAEALEASGAAAEVYDRKWRTIYSTTALIDAMRLPVDRSEEHYGLSPIARQLADPDSWGIDPESIPRWLDSVAPSVVHDVPPDDPDFEAVTSDLAEVVAAIDPANPPAMVITIVLQITSLKAGFTWDGPTAFTYFRLLEHDGSFAGMAMIARQGVPEGLVLRLSRGSLATYERMDRLGEPARRPTAILFADLEASGELSRRLSSRAYFELIRSMTDLIDESVAAHGGIAGKHAGDGASALFVAEDGDEQESCAGAIAAALAIREGVAQLSESLGRAIRVNVGLHWGATLMVGQVSTRGRLEITALGDEMNEAARIEATASGGQILASKPILERLAPELARPLGIDLDSIEYRTLRELGAEGKAEQDAGFIAVAELWAVDSA